MASLTISDLPADVDQELRRQAERTGRTREDVALALVASALGRTDPPPLPENRVARLQEAFRPYRTASGSAVDELIAQRRAEGEAERDSARTG